ncbi:MAG: hypothetical protein ACLSHH_08595 [Clostridia bacterium]
MKPKYSSTESGITMVSLVVTIIILIILAGISINVTIGDNGLITKAKQSKQNIILAGEAEAIQLNQLYHDLDISGELTEDEESTKKDEIIALLQKQVEELQKQVEALKTENAELKKQIEELRSQIASLQKEVEELRKQIADKNIEIEELKKQVSEKEEKIKELQEQLNNINSLLSQTNATADKILMGYKAYSGGKLLTGTMANNGALNASLNCGQSFTIPSGYTSGGKVTANSLASQTPGNATVNNLSNGVTAWVNGQKITGNGADVNNSYNSGYNDGQSQSTGTLVAQYNLGISQGWQDARTVRLQTGIPCSKVVITTNGGNNNNLTYKIYNAKGSLLDMISVASTGNGTFTRNIKEATVIEVTWNFPSGYADISFSFSINMYK